MTTAFLLGPIRKSTQKELSKNMKKICALCLPKRAVYKDNKECIQK